MGAEILNDLFMGKTLDRARARQAMGMLIDGEFSDAQAVQFLSALKNRPETVAEIVGFAEAMRERAVLVEVGKEPLVDTCGTGGDGSSSFNISTASAIIAAGAGASVAKHGNRAVSSRCGSADVLEALGVQTWMSPKLSARCIEETGVGFLFAQALHPGLKKLAPLRQKLGRTVFNLLGPLANPARARRQVLGVYSRSLVPLVAAALRELGSEEAMVVSSYDGLDEISLCAKTAVAHLKRGGQISEYDISGEAQGFQVYPKGAFAGGDAAQNAKIILSVLNGEAGPARDVSIINAAAALLVAGKAADLKAGAALAKASVDEKRALAALEKLKALSHVED